MVLHEALGVRPVFNPPVREEVVSAVNEFQSGVSFTALCDAKSVLDHGRK